MEKILLVGCGNMAGAMLEGWLASGVGPDRFTVMDPQLPEAPGNVELVRELPDRSFDAILLGVKPRLLDRVVPGVAPLAGAGTAIFSMLAGVELGALRRRFPDAAAIVRVMPNLAARINKSPIALVGEGIDQNGRKVIGDFFDRLGMAEWLEDEGSMDLVTALAGSGPAYVYRFIDALAKSAETLGLPRDQADRLALQMVEGAAALAAASEHDPGELADRVASPGGTTRAGMDVLDDEERINVLMEDTLRAAASRSAEMAAEAR